MKKLLSICFLSILLGLLSFSTQAQSNGSSCKSGFWIENLQPDTIPDIVNLPTGMPTAATGKLPLSHTLGKLWYGSTGQYLGNAHPQDIELYELHFCNTCGLDPKTKLSIDWLVIRDGDTINDNLSEYMELSIYTFYNQLNQYGQCQSIQWLGGQVPNEFGYCNQVSGSYTLYDSIHGLNNTGCNTPTNYPGALQASQGYPYSVITQMNQIVPAMGLAHIYTQALDYFYLDFFEQTRTIVQIKWKQVGDYKLVMRIRERTGGTAYNNLTWNANETTDFIGGHQSCCGQVLAEDVIGFPSFGEACMEVCENETYTIGSPAYTFTQTTPDTNVVFGQYVFDNTNCKYFQVDSIYKFHFYERHTPQVVVKKAVDTLCRCATLTTDMLNSMIAYDSVDFQYATDHYFMWRHRSQLSSGAWSTWSAWTTDPVVSTTLGTHEYQIYQVNQYSTCGVDTLCTGNPVTITITFKEMVAPALPAPGNADFCLESIDATSTFTITSTPDPDCADMTRWYTNARYVIPGKPGYSPTYNDYFTNHLYTESRLDYVGNSLVVNLHDYIPSSNKDTVVYFFATSYDTAKQCESPKYTIFKITFHQTPELAKHILKDVYCPGSEVEMQVTVSNNPQDTDPNYTYHWGGDLTDVLVNGTKVPFVAAQNNTVGTGNSGNAYFPFYTNAKNSYTQQIFTPAEVGSGAITKVTFDYSGAAALTKDVAIYFTTTNQSTFNTSTRAWYTDNLQLAYEGTLNVSAAGLVEIELQHPYVYTSTTENLVMAIAATSDNTIAYGNNFKTTSSSGNMGMAYYGATKYDNPNNIPNNSTNRRAAAHRNNVTFHVEGLGYTISGRNQYAYNQLSVTDPDSCGTSYTTTAYVVDGNGCKSNTVEFKYSINDTVNPTVSQSTVTTNVYACHLNTTNAPTYTTVAALEAGAGVTFNDDCGKAFLKIANVTTTVNSVSDTTCHEVLTRVYTIKDHCGNPVTFTQVFVSQDTTKPSFVFAPGAFPYVRLFPVEGGNCTFNSPDSMEFVNAVASHVFDNCTDSAYLMSTVKFFWENTTESPINGKDIFRIDNHLSVVAQITDRCGNVFQDMIIYLDRPDHISIDPNAVTTTGNQCFGDTATLHFNVDYIKDDTIMGPFVPYTYQWREVNGRNVIFTAVNDTTTQVIFPETGDYSFEMVVTDRNGCFAVSTPPALINVRPLPKLVINHIVLNGQTEPYCPTYGNLTIRAEIVDPVAGQTVDAHAYRWTGESVNVISDSARTWVTIVPEWCDTLYYPTVTVKDDRGCVGTVTDTIEVKANGPVFNATLPDTTVAKQAGCVYRIPDFKNLIDASIVDDDCYTFTELKYSDAYGTVERPNWYSQSPVANTLLTTPTQAVTITITNPCGKSNSFTVNVNQPDDALAVAIVPTDTAECQSFIENTGIEFNTVLTNAVGTVDYAWTVGNSTTVLGTNDSYLVKAAMNPGTYTYRVDIEDELGCTAHATADLTVYFQGADPQLRKWPNTLCERFNGALVVDYAPTGYAYDLQHNDYSFFHFFKISENPNHQPTEWNTITFDSLRPGMYTLTVYTDHDCERSYQVEILNNSQAPDAPTFTKVNVTVCTNNNGQLTINAQPNFSYELYNIDVTPMELIGTATSYDTLHFGHYMIHATNNLTHCSSDASFELLDEAPRPTPTANYTANANCDNADGVYTGTLTITSSLSWQYTIYTEAGDTLKDNVTLTNATKTLSGLHQGKYYITAYNPATSCYSSAPVVKTIGTNYQTPTIQTSSSANHYCTTTKADGTVTITNANRFFSYILDEKHGLFSYDSIGDQTTATMVTSSSARWSELSDMTYRIRAIADNYCTASPVNVTVGKSTKDPEITATSTINPSCVKELGTITLKTTNASAMNTTTYGNAHIASYKIEKGAFVIDSATTANQITFDNLASGVYNYTATTQYGCTKTGSVEIEQYQLPTMVLDSTPNHMCAPTFEKPGDGTVTVVKPTVANTTPGTHFFMYYFFDAADVNMDVPYELPLTNTKYWLAAKRYHVVAVDTVTGCTVDGYITVEDSLYEVNFDYETTPNYACNTVDGNGSITVLNVTSTNPDAVFAYSLDDVTYTLNPVFTGLKDSTYTVYVKDTVSACVKMKSVPVNPTDSCAPIITICDNLGLCGDQFDYCIGSNAELCGSVNDTCNPSHVYTYGWYAPCSDPSNSNTNCIAVQTDHYVVNSCDYIFTATNTVTGCSYNKTVHVAIHPNPVLVFTINGTPATQDQRNWVCETEPLHIAVHSNNPDVILDTTSITWTQGIVGTGFAEFDTIGTAISEDHITFCVRANSKFGCPSPIASLPVSFVRTDTVMVKDTACASYIAKADDYDNPADVTITPATYPFDTIVVRKYVKTTPVHGQLCDSVAVHNVRIVAKPEITPATVNVDPFCESAGYKLADFVDSFSVAWNGDTTGAKWIAADAIAVGDEIFTKVTSIADITTGRYLIAEQSGEYTMTTHKVGSNNALVRTSIVTTNPSDTTIWTITKDGSNYTIYNDGLGSYLQVLNANGFGYSSSVSNSTKWNMAMSGSNIQIKNVQNSSRYIKYNTSSPRFACYDFGTEHTSWIALYKSNHSVSTPATYTEVAGTQALTYDYVSTHDIKRVASNCCGADTADIEFTVYKQPAINSFVAGNGYCAGDDSRFAANISTFGTPATAKLFIEGNTTPIATATVNGLNQAVTFSPVTLSWAAHNGKTITLNVTNDCTPNCGPVTLDSVLVVDTTYINGFVSNEVYCVGDVMTIADFGGFDPSAYESIKLYKMNGATPNPSSDHLFTLPYTHTNQTYDSALVYIVASNHCFPTIISNVDTIFVNGKPEVSTISNINMCASALTTIAEPGIDWHGSNEISKGWLLMKGTSYVNSNVNEIKDSAMCKLAHAAYYAQGTCGSDTTFFTVKLVLPPTISISLASQCPNELVNDVMSTTTVDCGTYVTHHFSLVKEDGTGYYWPVFTSLKFKDIVAYNGGKLSYVYTNNCGTDSAGVVLNIPVYAYDTFKLQNACNNTELSNFIQTGTYDWKGSVAPTLSIDTTYWSVNGVMVNPASYTVDATVTPLDVTYSYVTSCHDTITTDAQDLTPFINDKPEVNLTNLAPMCEGDTIKVADLLANLTVTYIQPTTAADYDTTWYIGSDVMTFPYAVSYADSGKKVIVSINEKVANSTCGNTNDTIELVVYPRPNPTITGPAEACADKPLSMPFTAGTGYTSYVFTVVGDATPNPASPYTASGNTYDPTFSLSTPLSSAHDTVYVTVTDDHGCVGTSTTPAIIRVTNGPSFIFADMSGNETHEYTLADTGVALQYTWRIGVDCYDENPLVYVEYDIYHNDTLIANNKIGSYLKTKTTGAIGMPGSPYVTSNELSWCANHGIARPPQTIYYNYASANPTASNTGNHFPYSTLNEGSGHDYFDCFFLNFLARRSSINPEDNAVTATINPFRVSGEYKVVYRLMATDITNRLYYYYSPDCVDGVLDTIGSKMALNGNVWQLAIDSIQVHIGGTATTISADVNEEEAAAPELAPVVSDVDAIVPDMEVWPNPAPAVETTLKARVHNMSGNATVTLTSLTGKQVYSGDVYIDNDNYYFEFNVNNLSVGSYIMTVRTDADVITKKVIVARLAK